MANRESIWCLAAVFFALQLLTGLLVPIACGPASILRKTRDSSTLPQRSSENDDALALAPPRVSGPCSNLSLPSALTATALDHLTPLDNGDLVLRSAEKGLHWLRYDKGPRQWVSSVKITDLPTQSDRRETRVLAAPSGQGRPQLLSLVGTQVQWHTAAASPGVLEGLGTVLLPITRMADGSFAVKSLGAESALVGWTEGDGAFVVQELRVRPGASSLATEPVGTLNLGRGPVRIVGKATPDDQNVAVVAESLGRGQQRLWALKGHHEVLLLEGLVRDARLSSPTRLIVSLGQDPERSSSPRFAQTAAGGVWELDLGELLSLWSDDPQDAPHLGWNLRSRALGTALGGEPNGATMAWVQEFGNETVAQSTPSETPAAGPRRPSFTQRSVQIGRTPGQESEPNPACLTDFLDGVTPWPGIGFLGLGQEPSSILILP
jgi:hypothetical protein